MAAKGTLRNLRPVVLAISTNDALGNNARNIGILLNTKNIYFVPFGQDNPEAKPTSCVADLDRIGGPAAAALDGRPLQRVLIERRRRAVRQPRGRARAGSGGRAMAGVRVAVVGATVAFGQELVPMLAERSFPVPSLKRLASPRSA